LVLALVLTPAAQAQAPLIQTASNPTLGTILVNAQGMTLYYLTSEAGGKIKCSGQCLNFWPPLLLPAGMSAPTAASGVTGTLGVVSRPDGSKQVTYNGFPLYTFANDKAAGDTNGNGIRAFGGAWFAATASSVQLAATVAERLTIGITTTGGTVWGKVVARYSYDQQQVVQVCSKRTCSFPVPHGVRVHLSQTPTDAMSWPFKNWELKGLRTTARTQVVTTASTSFKMKRSYRVNVVYTVMG
jgi:predicted lipoprotein with Yx(FWY)xxD motif